MPRHYQIPGGPYVNVTEDGQEYSLHGYGYLNELAAGSVITASDANASGSSTATGVSGIVIEAQRDGSGWERFKALKPLKKRLEQKKIPELVIEAITDIITEQDIFYPIKKPVAELRKELHKQEIQYEPMYGEALKLELKLAIQQQKVLTQQQDEEEILLLMAA